MDKGIFDKIKSDISISNMILLSGIIGNFIAYVYKASYFMYFEIPISLVQLSLYEIILYSCLVLLFIFSCLLINLMEFSNKKCISKEQENKYDILLSKSIFLILIHTSSLLIASLIYGIFFFTISSNIYYSVMVAIILLIIFVIILFYYNFKKTKEERIKSYEDLPEELKYVFLFILIFSFLIITSAFLGREVASNQLAFPIINTNEKSFIVIAENNENYICHEYYDGIKEINPIYSLINKNDIVSIQKKKLGRIKVIDNKPKNDEI